MIEYPPPEPADPPKLLYRLLFIGAICLIFSLCCLVSLFRL